MSYCLQRDPRDVRSYSFMDTHNPQVTLQRPSARELLKHKFVRMAKKTSYLTELIERHERWRAEGGERLEEEQEAVNAEWVPNFHRREPVFIHAICSHVNSDPEDLWDFGTVRHVSKPGTIGRTNNSIKVSGPPLTWEMNGSPPSEVSQSPTATRKRTSNSSIRKTELPPLPTSPQSSRRTSYDQQATVRHMPSGGPNNHHDNMQVIDEKRPTDEGNYDEDRTETYPRGVNVVQNKAVVDDEDDLPDTTMLDSVILPAIASVGYPLPQRA